MKKKPICIETIIQHEMTNYCTKAGIPFTKEIYEKYYHLFTKYVWAKLQTKEIAEEIIQILNNYIKQN